jgi:hypothetical protein
MIKTILSLPGNQPTRDELLQQLVRPCLFLLASPVGIFVILNPTDRMIISSTNSVDSRHRRNGSGRLARPVKRAVKAS